MEKRNVSKTAKIYTLIILVLLYLAIISFPLILWIDEIYVKIIDMSLKIAFIGIVFFSIKRYELGSPKFLPDKNLKLSFLIPLVVITFSNWIYVWIFKFPINSSINGGMFTLTVFGTLITVFCEELLFREITHNCFKEIVKQDYLRTLISAAIFSLLHFLNFFSGTNILLVLAQVGYTFVLGLILGLIKEKGAGLIALVSFHFLFNVLNNDLFSVLYKGEWNTEFVVTNIIIGAVVVSYGVLLYFLLKVKPSSLALVDDSENQVNDASNKEEN